LSGGVDSSLVTAISSEKLNIKNINTFSVIFNDKDIKYYYPRSEEKFIDYVSKKYTTTNNKYLFETDLVKSALVEAIWFHEMPLNGPSTSLYLLLAKKIKDKTTVLITGEGADDIFLGYFSRWKFDDIKTFYKQFTNTSYLNFLFGKKKSLNALSRRNELLESPLIKNMSTHDKATLITMKVYLHGLLARHDRMFMSNGIEGRLPFCSDLVLKTRFCLPDKYIQNENEGKVILKKLAAQYYPKDFVYRKKIGFSSPFGDWCSSPNYWRNYYEKLDKDFIGYISNPEFFIKHKLMNESKEKWSGQNLNIIFNYINISLWYAIFFESEDFTKRSSWKKIVEYYH
jgi:asparagine synthase (glutamine-hydrolysing)